MPPREVLKLKSVFGQKWKIVRCIKELPIFLETESGRAELKNSILSFRITEFF